MSQLREVTSKSSEAVQVKMDSSSDIERYEGTAEHIELDRSTLLRLDLLLVPMCCMVYLLAFLDRANIGNARIAGLQSDLKMSDKEYQTGRASNILWAAFTYTGPAITLTYVPYIVAELPSNLVFKKVGARLMLPIMMFSWGGMFPGIVLYLSSFYKPHELQVRIALFFSAAALSGAFSGLLAAAIEKMDGIANLPGWSWIFMLEGLFTLCFAVFAFWSLPNGPQQVKSFKQQHKDWCEQRLRSTTSIEVHGITTKQVLSVFKDLHIWILLLILFTNGVTLFGLSYFTPSIVHTLGYDTTRTQLLSVPPFACAFFVTMLLAYVADRYKARGLTAIVGNCIALVGFAIFLTQRSREARYAALVLMVTGVYSSAPSLISWIPNNVSAHARRATAVAMGFVATNTGGIVSTWIYPRSSAPSYTFAARFNISLVAIGTVLIVAEMYLLSWMNKQKGEGKKDYLVVDMKEMSDAEQINELGDHHPAFKYTL